ncbi:hypothetical protein P7C71_g256, partial [Lecanoromycetidae sp. Uapishka_2]
MATEQELADLERLSNDYVPDVKGPLVGEQQSTRALVAEYAQADPIYIHKTAALPSKYSHYRTEALAFGYFEALLRIGKPDKILAEIPKLTAYNKIFDDLGKLGNKEMMYEEFVEETLNLLKETARSLPNHDGERTILAAFNNQDTSNAITYHFRMIAGAWLRSHADHYSMFLPDGDIETYCSTTIDPFSVELEHIGLQALATALINEAGIDIEILYLDRSTGTEVTPHKTPVVDAAGEEVESLSTIRLLYRPGHYDLLYKTEDIVEMSIPALASPEIRLVSDQPTLLAPDNFMYPYDVDPLICLPGYSLVASSKFAPATYQSPKAASAAHKPLSPAPKRESPPKKSQQPQPSPPSPSKTLPVQLKIRPHLKKLEYDYERPAVPDAITHDE